jgi:ribosomal protein L11 methyltransferase
MIELFPAGFEEVESAEGIELAAYTDRFGERRLRQAFGTVVRTEVAAGWEERWREFHRPVRVGPLWIGPPWATARPGAAPVVIDPGLAFGTGAHPTTRLCLGLLLAESRGSVLDVGCGSGVLAIAAVRLGFGPVEAIDIDPAAVEATLRNAAANGVELSVRAADGTAAALPPTRLALANLSHGVLQTLGRRLAATRVLASGYLAPDEPPCLPDYRWCERRTLDGWAADAYERTTK